jgi:hypothetical protein
MTHLLFIAHGPPCLRGKESIMLCMPVADLCVYDKKKLSG